MRYKLALLVTFCAGLLAILAEFLPGSFGKISTEVEIWLLIISGFAIVLGILNLLKMNCLKVYLKLPNWQYYLITLISFTAMFLFGICFGMKEQVGLFGEGVWISNIIGEKPFDYIFDNIYQHLMASMFSILAFYIASAAYRAFIARSLESTLLLTASILVMLGNTTVGASLTSSLPKFLHLPEIQAFIMDYPNTAGQRAIMIGAGLGVIGSSLRIILGLERSYLGGNK